MGNVEATQTENPIAKLTVKRVERGFACVMSLEKITQLSTLCQLDLVCHIRKRP